MFSVLVFPSSFALVPTVFITLFLIILFLLNLKQDKESIIREKIKRFKFALLSEYVYKSDENSLKDISNFFLQHKHQINYDIKKMLGKQNEKNTTLIETLLEKTWSEVNQIIINRDTSDENKIKYGFYGEVVLDLILQHLFSSNVLLAKGYFYNPLENSETKGYDSYQFYYNNNQLINEHNIQI